MTGALITHGELGSVVTYAKNFQVGAGASPQADRVAREQARKDRDAWIQKSCNDINVITERLRLAGKLTGKEPSPAEQKMQFDSCVKEVGARKTK